MLYENDRQYKLAAPDVDELLRIRYNKLRKLKNV